MTDFRSELAWLVEMFESYNDSILNEWTGVPGCAENLKAELERAKAILAMTDWQPIETAPKDGLKVLLYRGSYCEVERWETPARGPQQWSSGPEADAISPATHWMPLPDPPKD